MIRKLLAEDQAMLMDYLANEVAFNLFIIGDVENFGMETDFMQLWGEFDGQNRFKSVLLRFYNYFVLYSKDNDYDVEEIDRLLRQHDKVEGMSGKKTVLDRFMEHTSSSIREKKDTYFVSLTKPVKELPYNSLFTTEKGQLDDVDDVVDLLKTITEFGEITETARESMKSELMNDTCKMYIVRDEEKIAATARTAAENSRSAMIVGVATKEEYRNKGLASQCMTKLCKDLQVEGKGICLFYDNPKAGSIYRALGFEDLGMWTIIKTIDYKGER